MIRFVYLLLLITSLPAFSQDSSLTICSWNLKDFGRSKSDEEIEFIAQTIKQVDILLVQEVVAKDPAGAQAVGRLGEVLKRTGEKWDYRVSDITSGENSYKRERYAFLWKTAKVSLYGKPWLDRQFHEQIDREPFMGTFISNTDTFTLVNFHAITKANQPEREVKYFKFFPETYPDLNLIFCGDFNLPQEHTVFNPLKKMSYVPALKGQKTSMKKNCVGEECLSEEFDNFFFLSTRLRLLSSFVIHFYKNCHSMEEANLISDHLPVIMEFNFLKQKEMQK